MISWRVLSRRFVFVAKHWFRFLGKWRDPIRNPQFKSELDSSLKELRDGRGYTDETLSTRETALDLFFDWLGKQSLSLKGVSPATIDTYFVQHQARGWRKSTTKAYGQSLPFVLVGRHDDASRRCVIPNQLHIHGVRGAAKELFAFSKNYRTGEQ